MTRCAACPVAAGEVCLGETGAMPGFCGLAPSGDRSHLDLIVARSRVAAGADPGSVARNGRPGPVPVPPSVFAPCVTPCGGRVRVGLLAPVLVHGGAESWMWAVARFADPARVCFTGLAVTHGAGSADPDMVARFRGVMPVGFGPGAVTALAGCSDVLLGWAVWDVARRTAGVARRPAVVFVSHSPADSRWAVDGNALATGVDRWVAVSELAVPTVPAAARADALVVPNCVDPDRLVPRRPRAAVRAAWGVPGDAPVAVYFGRLTDEKDPLATVRLAGSLPDPWRVVVVGGDTVPGDFAARDASLDPPRLRVVGPDPDAGSVLSAADVCVVPSLYESFGLTIAEAAWCGVPVVSTASGVAKLVPGLTRVVPVSAAGPTLAAAVLADHADAAGTARRAAAARAYARKHFAPAAFGRRWTDVLVSAAPAAAAAVPDADLLARVAGCPDRGPVLPVARQPECGCSELSGCRAGKGRDPGSVSLADCVQCVSSRPPTPEPVP